MDNNLILSCTDISDCHCHSFGNVFQFKTDETTDKIFSDIADVKNHVCVAAAVLPVPSASEVDNWQLESKQHSCRRLAEAIPFVMELIQKLNGFFAKKKPFCFEIV